MVAPKSLLEGPYSAEDWLPVPTTREARPSPATQQSSVFARDIAPVARAMGRDFGSCYLDSLGSAITEALLTLL